MLRRVRNSLSSQRVLCSLLSLSLLAPLPVPGQTGLGSITGETIDPTGAKLPHSSLRLVEKSTGSTSTTEANAEGIFIFPSVAVGHYTLTIKAAGFRERQIDNLDVSAYQRVSLGKVALEIGA